MVKAAFEFVDLRSLTQLPHNRALPFLLHLSHPREGILSLTTSQT